MPASAKARQRESNARRRLDLSRRSLPGMTFHSASTWRKIVNSCISTRATPPRLRRALFQPAGPGGAARSAPVSSASPPSQTHLHRRCRRLLRRAGGDHCRHPRLGLPRHRRQLRGTARRGRRRLRLRLRAGHRMRYARQGLVSLRQCAHVAREPRLDGGVAEDDDVRCRRLEVPRHPRRRRCHQPLRLRVAARGDRRGAGASRRGCRHRPAMPACRSSRRSAGACGSTPASSACRPTTARPTSGTASSASKASDLAALDAPARLRPPRRRRRHAPLRPRQRLCPHAGDGPVAEPRRVPAAPSAPPPARKLRPRTLRIPVRAPRSPSSRVRLSPRKAGRPG